MFSRQQNGLVELIEPRRQKEFDQSRKKIDEKVAQNTNNTTKEANQACYTDMFSENPATNYVDYMADNTGFLKYIDELESEMYASSSEFTTNKVTLWLSHASGVTTTKALLELLRQDTLYKKLQQSLERFKSNATNATVFNCFELLERSTKLPKFSKVQGEIINDFTPDVTMPTVEMELYLGESVYTFFVPSVTTSTLFSYYCLTHVGSLLLDTVKHSDTVSSTQVEYNDELIDSLVVAFNTWMFYISIE